MTDKYNFSQQGQDVRGPQTNIPGNVNAPVLSGEFYAPVILGGTSQPLVPRQIRQPPSNFKGRENEIIDLQSNFEKGAIITGMGGIGKTALALVLVEKLKDQFPDGQLYIDLLGTRKEHLSPSQAIAHIILSYRPGDSLPEDSNQLIGLYRSVMAEKRALLLLDNAADREQIEPILPPSGCAVLITSRNKFTVPELKPGLREIDLSILPPDKACELLLAIAERIGDQVEELAKLCGYLPLALRNAASVLAERIDFGVANYVPRLRDAKERLGLIEASFSLSYDLLVPDLREKWCLLSIFPADFDYAGAAYIWRTDLESASDALSDLLKWSLVDYNPSTISSEYGRYRLHELARVFANSRLTPAMCNTAQQWHATYYLLVLSTANDLYEQGGENIVKGLELFDREQINIQAGQTWGSEVIREEKMKPKAADLDFALQISNAYPDAGSYLLPLRLHPYERIHWLEVSLEAARKLGDRKAEGLHLGNLGTAYLDIGAPHRAIEFNEQALTISRKIGNRGDECAIMGNLGMAFAFLGETSKAMAFYMGQLDISREIKDRREEGIALHHLGDVYHYLEDNRRAIEFYNHALGITREIGDSRAESIALGNIGQALFSTGDIKSAIEFFQHRLSVAQKIGDKRGESSALGRLGNAHFCLNNALKAIEFFERQLTITREILDRRGENCALSNIGNAYLSLGEFHRAIEYYEQALKIDREIDDRQGEGIDFGNLGNAYIFLNEIGKGIEYYERRLAIAREIGDSRGERNVLGNLGNAYALLGDPRKAIEYYEQRLAIAREICDPQGEGEALFNISVELDKLGQQLKAIDGAKAALTIFEQIESPRAEKVRQKLAEWQSSGEPEN
jgi:tetratricopeptide (TPR) repeat protein